MSLTHSHRCPRERAFGVSCLIALVLASSPLVSDAQQPTPQQQNAIRQSCRSDFQANCAGVPAGGSEALQCLKQNVSKVSPACQQALAPVMGGAAPAAGGAPGSAPAAGGAVPTSPGAAPTKAPAKNAGQGRRRVADSRSRCARRSC
jgi:hypothetical protein